MRQTLTPERGDRAVWLFTAAVLLWLLADSLAGLVF
jgi:hypothetical protein